MREGSKWLLWSCGWLPLISPKCDWLPEKPQTQEWVLDKLVWRMLTLFSIWDLQVRLTCTEIYVSWLTQILIRDYLNIDEGCWFYCRVSCLAFWSEWKKYPKLHSYRQYFHINNGPRVYLYRELFPVFSSPQLYKSLLWLWLACTVLFSHFHCSYHHQKL